MFSLLCMGGRVGYYIFIHVVLYDNKSDVLFVLDFIQLPLFACVFRGKWSNKKKKQERLECNQYSLIHVPNVFILYLPVILTNSVMYMYAIEVHTCACMFSQYHYFYCDFNYNTCSFYV